MSSIYDYLEQINLDAAGLLAEEPEQHGPRQKNDSVMEDYSVTDNKEQPHTFAGDNRD